MSGLSMPRMVLASEWTCPEPDSPTRPQRLGRRIAQGSPLDQRRHVVTALVEHLPRRASMGRAWGSAVGRVSVPTTGGGSVRVGDPIAMVAACPAAVEPTATIGGLERSGTARRPAGSGPRTRRSAGWCRSGAGCPGSWPRARSVLRDAAPRERAGGGPSVYGCSGLLEDCRRVALLDDLAGVHHPDPVAHRPDDARGCVRSGGPRHWSPACSERTRSSTLRLDGGVEPGGRFVEHQ